jgi:hypothetical protein
VSERRLTNGSRALLTARAEDQRRRCFQPIASKPPFVLADDPERLAATFVAQDRDLGAERDRRRARGFRLQNRARDAFREIARIPRCQFQSATALVGVLYRLRGFERLLAVGEGAQ